MDMRNHRGGILIRLQNDADISSVRRDFFAHARRHRVDQILEETVDTDAMTIRFTIESEFHLVWAPRFDTLQLGARLGINSFSSDIELEREVMLSMLLSPVAFEYPSFTEFDASIRVRTNIVRAARNTSLTFHTSKIKRPEDYWIYSERGGFTLRRGKPLIDALRKSTQPEPGAEKYSFSCYRATEYVILLGIVQELQRCNPDLLKRLQRQWEKRAIVSRQFHAVFLREYGSASAPLPLKYFVPGDRLWFRNPDEFSSDVAGYEGSWVIYLGNGLFANFWAPDQPYTLEAKCIEIYHWRNAVCRNADGDLWIDEEAVKHNILKTMSDAGDVQRILKEMVRPRDSRGVYADGGCMDITREFPRCLHPETTDICLPD